jgi:hypothetical protein
VFTVQTAVTATEAGVSDERPPNLALDGALNDAADFKTSWWL